MTVELWSITPKAEELMVKTARVSANTDNSDTKLLAYCMKHGHHSVFEHGHATFDIHTSRSIAPQLLRHRSFCFQEFSQRYSEVKDQPVLTGARSQDTKNRQNSNDDMTDAQKSEWRGDQLDVWIVCYAAYEDALKNGIAKELARTLLPGMSPTRLFMTGNIRSWVHYCNVRSEKSTQLEHREISDAIWKTLRVELPVVTKAAEEIYSTLKEIT
jgi:thymidylate synthase (FAD)